MRVTDDKLDELIENNGRFFNGDTVSEIGILRLCKDLKDARKKNLELIQVLRRIDALTLDRKIGKIAHSAIDE